MSDNPFIYRPEASVLIIGVGLMASIWLQMFSTGLM